MYTFKQDKRTTGAALAKPAVQLGQDFCMETSMHGFRHIAESGRHWFERILWVAATCLAAWGAVYVSLGQLQRYNESPTVVTLEKNFRSWQNSLPAITACMKKRVDPTKLPQVIKDTWGVDSSDESYGYFSKFVHTVAESDLLNLQGYQEFRNDERLNVDLYNIAVGVMPSLDIKTTFSERTVLKWTPIMTEAGVCYATNSLALDDVAIIAPNPNDTALLPLTCNYGAAFCQILLEASEAANYYFHSPYDVLDLTSPSDFIEPGVKRMVDIGVTETGCGRGVDTLSTERRQCRFIDEADPGRKNSVMLYVTCPSEVIEPGVKRMLDIGVTETGCGRGVDTLSTERRASRFIDEPHHGRKNSAMLYLTCPSDVIEPGVKRMVDIGVTEIGCGRGVDTLSTERRQCRFIDEPDHGRKVYSTNSCRLTCRSKVAMKLCGCRPFYYFYEAGQPCNVTGMRCLSEHSQQLASIEGVRCSCSAQCLYSVFRRITESQFTWQIGPFAGGGSCRYTLLSPKVRYRREIVFHFQDLIVSFGGAAGLFLGASFISFVEIFYFILHRILRAVSTEDHEKTEGGQPQKNTSSFEEQRIGELNYILELNNLTP